MPVQSLEKTLHRMDIGLLSHFFFFLPSNNNPQISQFQHFTSRTGVIGLRNGEPGSNSPIPFPMILLRFSDSERVHVSVLWSTQPSKRCHPRHSPDANSGKQIWFSTFSCRLFFFFWKSATCVLKCISAEPPSSALNPLCALRSHHTSWPFKWILFYWMFTLFVQLIDPEVMFVSRLVWQCLCPRL